jgi:hypothetical protein
MGCEHVQCQRPQCDVAIPPNGLGADAERLAVRMLAITEVGVRELLVEIQLD